MTFEQFCKVAMDNNVAITIEKSFILSDGIEIHMRRNDLRTAQILRREDLRVPGCVETVLDKMLYHLDKAEMGKYIQLVCMPEFPEAAGDDIKEISKKLEESKDD